MVIFHTNYGTLPEAIPSQQSQSFMGAASSASRASAASLEDATAWVALDRFSRKTQAFYSKNRPTAGSLWSLFLTDFGANIISSHLKVAKAKTFWRKSASSRSVLIKAHLAFPFQKIGQVDFLTRSETTSPYLCILILHLRYFGSSWQTNCGDLFGATSSPISMGPGRFSKSPAGYETRCQLCP